MYGVSPPKSSNWVLMVSTANKLERLEEAQLVSAGLLFCLHVLPEEIRRRVSEDDEAVLSKRKVFLGFQELAASQTELDSPSTRSYNRPDTGRLTSQANLSAAIVGVSLL